MTKYQTKAIKESRFNWDLMFSSRVFPHGREGMVAKAEGGWYTASLAQFSFSFFIQFSTPAHEDAAANLQDRPSHLRKPLLETPS